MSRQQERAGARNITDLFVTIPSATKSHGDELSCGDHQVSWPCTDETEGLCSPGDCPFPVGAEGTHLIRDATRGGPGLLLLQPQLTMARAELCLLPPPPISQTVWKEVMRGEKKQIGPKKREVLLGLSIPGKGLLLLVGWSTAVPCLCHLTFCQPYLPLKGANTPLQFLRLNLITLLMCTAIL